MKSILYKTIVLSFVFFHILNIHAQDIRVLLKQKIHLSTPYLLINIKSNDCIMCRTACFNLMEQIKNKNKAIVLFDDSVMVNFVDDNAEKFNGYELMYDKYISSTLTPDSVKSEAFLVFDTGIIKYRLSNLMRQSIDTINSSLDSARVNKAKLEKELNRYLYIRFYDDNFILDENTSIFFDMRNQVGLINIVNQSNVFIKPSYGSSDSVLHILEKKVKPRYKNILTDSFSRVVLKKAGFKPILVKDIEYDGVTSVGIQLNAVLDRKNSDDTEAHVGLHGIYFLGIGNEKISDALNLDSYNKYFLIDTIHFNKKYLLHNSNFGHMIVADKLYISFFEVDSLNYTITPKRHYIVEMGLDKENEKAIPLKLFPLDGLDKDPKQYLFFKIDESGFPVVVYPLLHFVTYCKTGKDITFDELLNTQYDSTYRTCDAQIKGDIARFVFLKKGSTLIVSTYNYRRMKADVKVIPLNQQYEGGKFIGDKLRLYRKDSETKSYCFYDVSLK